MSRNMMRTSVSLAILALLAGCSLPPLNEKQESYLADHPAKGSLALVSGGIAAPIHLHVEDHPGVIRAAEDLQSDLEMVSGIIPEVIKETGQGIDPGSGEEIILVGTLGKHPAIDRLVESGMLDVDPIIGKWESSVTAVIDDPYPGVSRALVIAGSDMRGTIYGIYELSQQIGVSPWYYWADVIPAKREEIHAMRGVYVLGEPAVRYRGIFINDEAPALAGWVHENFGSFNHDFYEHVFELILRMKGNYLWPAMWGRAFYDDDPVNASLANEYGIVIGTTHHEPMMRAHVEWARYGNGPWDYQKNTDTLRAFWRTGIERMGTNESIVSLGMRGDGDEPMTDGTAIALLEEIVENQRSIIREVTGNDASETPQLWALYKEVQDYYDKGMRVPEDVTLLLCDDNWGNIRKLPLPGDPGRTGGYGIYYHFDYVGGPRNYKWLNTTQIERVWEQMHLAHQFGANQIWIVNVGDIKPMEFPIQFFLDMAWDPGKMHAEDLPGYYREWSRQQFGDEYAEEIGHIIQAYTKFNARRKPELLSPETYSLIHFREAERVVAEYEELVRKAGAIYDQIPERVKDAYYQLVLFPVAACANLNELYFAAAKNRLYAAQGRASTNLKAEKVRKLFQVDTDLADEYHQMAGGKWNHMMSQTHIGYTYWQQPEQNNMPEVMEITLPEGSIIGIALEGTETTWPGGETDPVLPLFDAIGDQEFYVEVFNRGSKPFHCSISPSQPWIRPSLSSFTVDLESRISFQIDWDQVPPGTHRVPVEISGNEQTVTIYLEADNREINTAGLPAGTYIGSNGKIAMEAAHYQQAVSSEEIRWELVPNLGRTHSAVIAIPVTAGQSVPGGTSPHLQYQFYARDTGEVVIKTYLSPTLNFHNTEGLRFAISLDGEIPRTVNMHDPFHPDLWNRWVADNIIVKSTEHRITEPGLHTLKFWRIDAGVVLQKIVVFTDTEQPSSYLGPPESPRISP